MLWLILIIVDLIHSHKELAYYKTHKEQHMLISHLHYFVFLYLFGFILKTWIQVSYEEWAPVWGNEDANGPTLNLHQVANLFG